MEVFNNTLTQMLMMFLLISVGFFLRKKNFLPENAYVSLSKLETYVFAPALTLHTFTNNCTVASFRENAEYILYGFLLAAGAALLSHPLSRLIVRNKKGDAKGAYLQNIYKYALTFGNWGYLGNFLILQLFGAETFFLYSMYTMMMSVITNSWGLYILIPKEQNAGVWKNLKKGLLAPPIMALFLGILFGFTGAKAYMPAFVMSALDSAGKCMGPAAMLLAGIVIGGYDFRSLFNNKKVYVVTAFRLVLIPAVMLTILRLMGAPEQVQIFTLFAFAAPLGLNTIVYPAAYGGETKTGAAMTIISSTLSVTTIPLMYLLFMVIL